MVSLYLPIYKSPALIGNTNQGDVMIAYFECNHDCCVEFRDKGMLSGCAIKNEDECKSFYL